MSNHSSDPYFIHLATRLLGYYLPG